MGSRRRALWKSRRMRPPGDFTRHNFAHGGAERALFTPLRRCEEAIPPDFSVDATTFTIAHGVYSWSPSVRNIFSRHFLTYRLKVADRLKPCPFWCERQNPRFPSRRPTLQDHLTDQIAFELRHQTPTLATISPPVIAFARVFESLPFLVVSTQRWIRE